MVDVFVVILVDTMSNQFEYDTEQDSRKRHMNFEIVNMIERTRLEILVCVAMDFDLTFFREPNCWDAEGNRLPSRAVATGSASPLTANSFNFGPIPSCVAVSSNRKMFSKAHRRVSIVRRESVVSLDKETSQTKENEI